MSRKINCWEYNNCGNGPNSSLPEELKCIVAKSYDCDGLNGGTNGGRICWSIIGSLCKSGSVGHMATNIKSCMQCDFYQLVQNQELENFTLLRPKKQL